MTPRARFLACMRHQAADRPPLWEWGPWPSTLRRWRREGLGAEESPPELAECDPRTRCPVDLWMRPRFEERTLSENEDYLTRMTDRGIVERAPKNADSMSMPEHIEYPVKCRADWEALKRRWDASDAGRFPPDWADLCRNWEQDERVVIFQGPRAPSLFGFVRELMGPERALYAFYDEPSLVHDMMEFNTEFLLGLLPKVLESAPVAAVFFWEDMAYRAGPLISPKLFREFMVPRYRRMTELVRGAGVDVIMVDSDGDVSQLIPLWLESGINGVYPMEVAAGMDVAALRRQYGRDLLMTGGIDKRALAKGRKEIDEELARRMPVAEKGGYIPTLDHAIPHDVPYENFRYYWKRKKEMIGVA